MKTIHNTLERQVEIMETHLHCFENTMEKMQYMSEFFAPDPDFTQEARNIVMGNICRKVPK
jgi:hypothetical protein